MLGLTDLLRKLRLRLLPIRPLHCTTVQHKAALKLPCYTTHNAGFTTLTAWAREVLNVTKGLILAATRPGTGLLTPTWAAGGQSLHYEGSKMATMRPR